jgi:hypothetical protein
MTIVHTDRLVDDYLRRLDAAASILPPDRRAELVSEIRDHLEEALRETQPSDEIAVRSVLDRLGAPEEIVSAAAEASPYGQVVVAVPAETNGLAIASLVLGVLWIWWIGSVLALVFGYRARREIKRSAGRQQGAGLALAGIVLGWIGIAVIGVGAVFFLGAAPFGGDDTGPARTPVQVTPVAPVPSP